MATGAETGTQRSPGAIWTLVVVVLATFMLMLDLTVVNVALPDIRTAFGSSFSSLQWILDAYALGLAGVLLAAGSLADRLGRKRVFDVGLIVFVLASLACGLAPSDTVLIIARFVQGLGGAILFAVGPALLGHEFRGKDRGMAFGMFGAVTGLAIAFGPLIGGALTESAGWRWIFLINVPLTIIAMAIGMLKMRESRSETPPPVDWPGMIAFSAGLFLLVLGFMRGEADGWTSFTVLGCFGLGVVLLVVFTWLQFSRPDAAMFDLSLFGNRTFNGLSAVTALCAITVMPALFLLIAYVQNMLGHSAFASGLRFLPLTLLLFVAAALAGMLVTKVKPGLLVGASQLLIAAGLAAVLLVDADSSWTALIPAMILIGLGMGVFNPPRAAFSIAVTTPDKSGMASGINETFQQAGVAIGIAAVGAFFQNQVSGTFAETTTAQRVFDEQAHTAGDAVAAAGPSAVLDGLPTAVAGTVRAAAESAFVDGLHSAMLLVAILAAVSGVIAFATMRWSDLDEAALDNPGVPADDDFDDLTTDTVPVPSKRATGRTGALAARRAAEIIAQAKADAPEDPTGTTLTKTPAAPGKTGARRTRTAAAPADDATRPNAGGGRGAGGKKSGTPSRSGNGRKPGSVPTRGEVGTEGPTDILERPNPATTSQKSTSPSRSRTSNRSADSGRFTHSGRSTGSARSTDTGALSDSSQRSTGSTTRSEFASELGANAPESTALPSDRSATTADPHDSARPSSLLSDRTSTATDLLDAPGSSARTSRISTATDHLDASKATALLSDLPSTTSGLLADLTDLPDETVRPAFASDRSTGDPNPSAYKPKRTETPGKHRLADQEPSTARSAGRHRLTTTATDTTTGPAPHTGSTGRSVGSGTTVGADRASNTSQGTRTAPTAAGTTAPTGSTSTTPRTGSRQSATAGAGTATATARAVITDVIPQPVPEQPTRAKRTTSANGSTAQRSAAATRPATTSTATTSAAGVAGTVGSSSTATTNGSVIGAKTTGSSTHESGAAGATTADSVATESATPRRSTSRQRSRTATRATKQSAPTEQPAEPDAQPARAAKQPGKAAAKQPAKAAKQPAKATTRQPAKKTATGGARRTAAKKAAPAAEPGPSANGAELSAKPAATGRKPSTKRAAGSAAASKAAAPETGQASEN